MAMKFPGSLVLVVLVTTSVFATAIADKTYQAGGSCPACPCIGWSCWNVTHEPQTINVGGSENWRFGFNYALWAFNHSLYNPFFVGDTVVFKYTTEGGRKHSVYLLPNFQSYNSCDIKSGKLLAGPDDGAKGFDYKLTAKQQHEDPFLYFACGEGNGVHCSTGLMRFALFPWPNVKKEKII